MCIDDWLSGGEGSKVNCSKDAHRGPLYGSISGCQSCKNVLALSPQSTQQVAVGSLYNKVMGIYHWTCYGPTSPPLVG